MAFSDRWSFRDARVGAGLPKGAVLILRIRDKTRGHAEVGSERPHCLGCGAAIWNELRGHGAAICPQPRCTLGISRQAESTRRAGGRDPGLAPLIILTLRCDVLDQFFPTLGCVAGQ